MTSWEFYHPTHGWVLCGPCDAAALLCDPKIPDEKRPKVRLLGDPEPESKALDLIFQEWLIVKHLFPKDQHNIARALMRIGLATEKELYGEPRE